MRIVIQRVSEASVEINESLHGKIKHGFLILLGIEEQDTKLDIDYLIQKIIHLRVFSDEQGKMNLSIQEVKGAFLIISQFTLFASTKKGNRPSFIRSAKPEFAIPLYELFLSELKEKSNLNVHSGVFGADMKIGLTNDGPVTIIIDSKNKE